MKFEKNIFSKCEIERRNKKNLPAYNIGILPTSYFLALRSIRNFRIILYVAISRNTFNHFVAMLYIDAHIGHKLKLYSV